MVISKVLASEMNLDHFSMALQPIQIAVLCSVLSAVGFIVISQDVSYLNLKKLTKSNSGKITTKQVLTIFASSLSLFTFAFIFTESKSISFAIAALGAAIPFIVNQQRADKLQRQRESAWPEAIDSLVSALQSGVTITDAVISLADHGPDPLRPNFQRVREGLKKGKTLEELVKKEKELLASAISDQVFETLLIAKLFGGRDSNNALRLLSEFIRDDIDVLEEIRTKFGWIRNSAALATAAPWLLLLLLSSQKATVEAFSSAAGAMILTSGVLMTAIAYLWMNKVGRIPQPARALR